jgi:short-subunit dehydrogenase
MKTALITGSTRGIGKQIGIDLLNKGYHVYFNGHSRKSCSNLSKELNNRKNFNILNLDLSDIKCIELINKQIKELDVIILNAGITDRTKFGKISLYNWNKTFDMNLTVPFFLVQYIRKKIKFKIKEKEEIKLNKIRFVAVYNPLFMKGETK